MTNLPPGSIENIELTVELFSHIGWSKDNAPWYRFEPLELHIVLFGTTTTERNFM